MNRIPVLIPVAFAALCMACGEDAPAPDAFDSELCEHHIDGPSQPLTAATSSVSAPDAAIEHTRIDVTLGGFMGQNGGVVAFESGEAGDFVFALDPDIPFAVFGPGGEEIPIESSDRSGASCIEIKVQHIVDLTVGRSAIQLGPTDQTLVRIVFEELAGHPN